MEEKEAHCQTTEAPVMTPAERMRVRNLAAAEYFRKKKEEHEMKQRGILRLLDDLIRDAALSSASISNEDRKPEKRFQCEECEYSTVRRNALLGHMRAVHARKKVLSNMENTRVMMRKETIKRTIVKGPISYDVCYAYGYLDPLFHYQTRTICKYTADPL